MKRKILIGLLSLVFVFGIIKPAFTEENPEEEIKRVAENFAVNGMSEVVFEEKEDFSMLDPILGENLKKFLEHRNRIIRNRRSTPVPTELEMVQQEVKFNFIEIEEEKAFVEVEVWTRVLAHTLDELDQPISPERGLGEWFYIYLKKNEQGEWKVLQALSDSFWNERYLPKKIYIDFYFEYQMSTEVKTEYERFCEAKEALERLEYEVSEDHLNALQKIEDEQCELFREQRENRTEEEIQDSIDRINGVGDDEMYFEEDNESEGE